MIFNEYERAAEIDEKQKFSSDIMTDGILLARFYKTNGLSREETQEKIKTILFKLDGCFTDKFKEKSLRDIMSGFDSFELMDNEPVYFYKEEMDIIKQLKNKTARKVLFAMLYIRKASGENEFEAEAKDINRLCVKRIYPNSLYSAYHELKELGYVKYTNFKGENRTEIIYPALNVQYTSEPVIVIRDKHNIMNYYWNYIGEGKFIFCKNCGKLVQATSLHVDYCDSCLRIMTLERYKRATNNYRNKKMSSQ